MESSDGNGFEVIERLKSLIAENHARDTNESDTRHRVIDFILHEVLSWPRNRVATEEFISPGFADYVLKKEDASDFIFLEAKKAGKYFELPLAYSSAETSSYISIAKLLSDESVNAAMQQVRMYCFNTGCEYAAISNGHEWIFFKTFERSKRWESMNAFVVRSLQFFVKEYTKAINNLSFIAITEKASLPVFLGSAPPKDRAIYFPKEKIAAFSHTIAANRLAAKLRPIVTKYFGVIADNDTEFMDRCYVSQRDYQGTSDGMRNLIMDTLTPYFQEYGVQQLDDTGHGGRLGGRLTKNLKEARKGEVLVLFGGKGSGKSTFLKRLLHHNPPRWLMEHGAIALVDLLKTPEDADLIRTTIWQKLTKALDKEGLLARERDSLLQGIFQDRFEIAERQDLAGLAKESEAYNLKLNALVAQWKGDLRYCAARLARHLAIEGRGAIVVIDNTDQYTSPVQDLCFTAAQEIADLLQCATLISMREERFFDSKIHGVLDAFQNSGFHISSPKPSEVFRKRLDYAVSMLRGELPGLPNEQGDRDFVRDASKYLSILSKTLANDQSPLNRFLTACAHGDIRLSLDLFRSFLLSGYTNVDEMLHAGSWNFLIHQVIRPVMTPNRYFYDEAVSDIPNIFQLRSARKSSHFTGLRILRKLGKGVDPSAPPYVSVAQLRAYFAETFGMIEDFEKNLDVLLKQGFVEANNRLDRFSEDVDSVKITNYGMYMLQEMAYFFTYLDLICTDTGVYDETVCSYLTEAAKKEYAHFTRQEERHERVKVRLDRVEEFLKYIEAEERREREYYGLGMPEDEMFSAKANASFDAEKKRVLASLKKQPKKSAAPRNERPH